MNEGCAHRPRGPEALMRVLSLSSGYGVEIRLEHTATPSKSITDFHVGLTMAAPVWPDRSEGGGRCLTVALILTQSSPSTENMA